MEQTYIFALFELHFYVVIQGIRSMHGDICIVRIKKLCRSCRTHVSWLRRRTISRKTGIDESSNSSKDFFDDKNELSTTSPYDSNVKSTGS